MNNTDGYHGIEEQKKLAAFKAAGEIQDNMILGLGTGSTVYHLIVKLAERVRGGLSIHAAATSARTEELAAHYGIPLIPFHDAEQIHLAIDGVDAIDPDFHSIKGGGGALFREKVIALKALRVIWIMNQSKLVPTLNGLTLPVEVVPFALEYVEEQVLAMGFTSCLRRSGDGPAEDGPDRGRLDKSGLVRSGLDRSRLVRNGLVRNGLSGDNPGANAFLTDNGNYILDLQGKEGMDYRLMAGKLKALTGVVETGLFGNICEKIIVGTKDGVMIKSPAKP
ncbi:ribose 5-phosphate isomerase A [Enterocloster aldenensis]|uniref:ribose 5-phosphate isomerase A n=1 Tax=Enterocloster aldenensis TaxID=358742 RepID=UPI0025A48C16|nr:ribose 5-phosphate isomerase A [Enterocloster aldenensis]